MSLNNGLIVQLCIKKDIHRFITLVNESNINIPLPFDTTILYYTVFNEWIDGTKYCLLMGANVDKGRTPPFVASRNNRITKMLVDAGANLNIPLYASHSGIDLFKAKILIDRDIYLPTTTVIKFSEQLKTFITHRNLLRNIAIQIMGIRKYKLYGTHEDVNVFKLIGKHIWSERMDE